MDAFEPGRSPFLNGLLGAARLCYEDPSQREESHLKEHLRHCAEVRRNLEAQYLETMQIRPKTALSKEVDPQIRAGFESFRQGLKRLDAYLEKPDREELRGACAQARSAVETMFDLLARLRQEEETFPVYSESPFIHELTHVALGVAKGDIPPELLKGRLDPFRERLKRTLGDFKQWSMGVPESPAVAELVPQVEKGLLALGAGLDEMAVFYLDQRKEHLKKGGEVVLKASQALQSLQQRLNAALLPDVVCPRCSHANSSGSRFCTSCEARLPETGPAPTSSLSVQAGGESPPRFAYVVRLEEAVEAHLAGDASLAELKSTVEWFLSRVNGGRQQMAGLKTPERAPSKQIEELARSLRQRLEGASQNLYDGAQDMLAYLQSQESERLREGLEKVRQGAASMASLQQEMARL